MKSLSCFICRQFPFEDIPDFANEGITFLYLWVKLKQQSGSFLLMLSPFVTRLGEKIA